MSRIFFVFAFLCVSLSAAGQEFSRADTLRGSIGTERSWWDVLNYAIHIRPDFDKKYLSGEVEVTYKVLKTGQEVMQLDLQQPLSIKRMLLDGKQKLTFTREGNAYHVRVPAQQLNSEHRILVVYEGHPREAKKAPWDGGFIFAKDSLGRPWMTVACQGLGASVWYPCKDHQSDEPNQGATLAVTAPEALTVVANGRMQSQKSAGKGLKTTIWKVVNPINNYCLVPYIGHYIAIKNKFKGEKGDLDVTYWVLDYREAKARTYLPEQAQRTLKSAEKWMGPYPFYEDGYQLVEAPHLGMEHQSAIAYGNQFGYGYLGTDLSGTGWGLNWDFIVVHESGHEWFGNNITANDVADMWIQESFTNYFETLFVEDYWGKAAADAYNYGNRRNILNDIPVVGPFGVNEEGSGDMYYKGANMLHSIRHSMDNDSLFRSILRGLNEVFYHQTVDGRQIEGYISEKAAYNYQPVFNQYLRSTKIPVLEYHFEDGKLFYRYSNCVDGFNLPLVWYHNGKKQALYPEGSWKSLAMDQAAFPVTELEFLFYITCKKKNS